jgi:hypothetical protein
MSTSLTSSSDFYCCERTFKYHFDEAVLKCSFISLDSLRIKLRVFKEMDVCAEKSVPLRELRDSNNTNGLETDMNHVRSVLAEEYNKMIAEASEEVFNAQMYTSGLQG